MRLCLSKVGEAVGHRFAVLVLTVFLESAGSTSFFSVSVLYAGSREREKKRPNGLGCFGRDEELLAADVADDVHRGFVPDAPGARTRERSVSLRQSRPGRGMEGLTSRVARWDLSWRPLRSGRASWQLWLRYPACTVPRKGVSVVG